MARAIGHPNRQMLSAALLDAGYLPDEAPFQCRPIRSPVSRGRAMSRPWILRFKATSHRLARSILATDRQQRYAFSQQLIAAADKELNN